MTFIRITSVFDHFSMHFLCPPQNGTLKIIDRKKHIFKLAQGEYISPEKIENIYIRSEPVAQLYVHGDSLQVLIKRPIKQVNCSFSVAACNRWPLGVLKGFV